MELRIWLILFGFIIFMIFATYICILSIFYPRVKNKYDTSEIISQYQLNIKQRRFTGYIILASIIAIMITSSVSSINQHIQNK